MEEIEDVEVEEESVEEAPVDEELSDKSIEEDLAEEEAPEEESESRPVYAEDVKEVIFRLRGDISNLSEKQAKYNEKIDDEILLKQRDISLLEKVAKELKPRPEMSPDLPFGVIPAESAHVSVPEKIKPGETFYSQDGKLFQGTPPRTAAEGLEDDDPGPTEEIPDDESPGDEIGAIPIEDDEGQGYPDEDIESEGE